ncbi:MAG: M20/M25/M40 family metallo-hydrolase, partial [Rhodoferax sp.]|nr:M20/M25/M40 family metallo-hydrolase [Rhodoferax sp.]
PGVEAGHLVFRDGPAAASCDDVTILVSGQGGHGAMPHLANDSLMAAAAIVVALQTVVSRNVDPRRVAVVSVGAFSAGKANNVIADRATLELSVRAGDREVRDLLESRIRALVTAQAESFGVRADIDYRRDYPVLVNTLVETDIARQVGLALVGLSGVTMQGEMMTGSEDFAFMLEHCPGSYVLIGNGTGAGGCMVHNPGYDFNDDILATGAAFWSRLAERFLCD